MKNLIRKIFTPGIALILMVGVAVPAPASAQTMTELQAMINQLMAQIAAMNSGAITQTPTTEVPSGKNGGVVSKFASFSQVNKEVEIGEETVLLKGKVRPVTYERNLNKVVLYVSPDKANISKKPWEVFNDLHIYVNGYNVRSLDVVKSSVWKQVGSKSGSPVYSVTIYQGNIKLPAKSAHSFDVSIETDGGYDGEGWGIWVPQNGITTWSKETKHVSYGPTSVFKYKLMVPEEVEEVEVVGALAYPIDASVDAEGKMLRFSVEFELAANDQDVYVKNVIDKSAKNGGISYFIDGPSEAVLSATLNSSADLEGNYYLVQEGDSEDFIVTVVVEPAISGTYRLSLDSLHYSDSPDGAQKRFVFDSDYRTPSKSVVIASPTPDPVLPSVPSTTVEVKPPMKNSLGCDRSVTTKLADGTLACYGMWDYGNAFGGDKTMCGIQGAGKIGCEIKTPICSSGSAKATAYYTGSKMTTGQLNFAARLLGTTPALVKKEVAGLWDYVCTPPSIVALPTCTLVASPISIMAGQTARLSWLSTNTAGTGTLNNGIGALDPRNLNGSRVVTPTKTTSYTLTVQNSLQQKATCTVQVIVVSAPSSTTSSSSASGTAQVLGATVSIFEQAASVIKALQSFIDNMKR